MKFYCFTRLYIGYPKETFLAVFEMKDELKLFAPTHKKEFLCFFNDELGIKSLHI